MLSQDVKWKKLFSVAKHKEESNKATITSTLETLNCQSKRGGCCFVSINQFRFYVNRLTRQQLQIYTSSLSFTTCGFSFVLPGQRWATLKLFKSFPFFGGDCNWRLGLPFNSGTSGGTAPPGFWCQCVMGSLLCPSQSISEHLSAVHTVWTSVTPPVQVTALSPSLTSLTPADGWIDCLKLTPPVLFCFLLSLKLKSTYTLQFVLPFRFVNSTEWQVREELVKNAWMKDKDNEKIDGRRKEGENELHFSLRSLIKVFLRDPLTTHLVDENCRALPSSRFISDILQQRGKTEVTINHNQDSIRELLGSQYSNDGNSNSSVLLVPVPERGSHKKIGLIVVVSQAVSLSSVDPKRVNLCVKQISMSYEVIRASLNKDTSPNVASLLSLMQLCGELNDQDAAKLEIKVMRYLQEQTEAESGFLLLVVPETQMLFCQAVGDSVLQEEVRFAGPTSCFGTALETKQPITLEDIPMDRRQEVEKIIRRQVHSLLCVPVCISDSKDLLALACVVNKSNHQEFNESDADIIRQCFKYTATVLTSTLAFQNERKLKNQTQALLQVARKLFTRLVESKQTAQEESVRAGQQTSNKVNLCTEFQRKTRTGQQSELGLPTPSCSNLPNNSVLATSCIHCSGQSGALHLPGLLSHNQLCQSESSAADNAFVLLPLSTWSFSAPSPKDAEPLCQIDSAGTKAKSNGHTEERDVFSHVKPLQSALHRSRIDAGDIDDQFITPDSSPKRRKYNAHTQTQVLSRQESSSQTHGGNSHRIAQRANQSQPPRAEFLRTSTPVTTNAVPSLSQIGFGDASNITSVNPCVRPSGTSFDLQASKNQNIFQRELEWMRVFFENINDFGSVISADVFTDLDLDLESMAQARELVTDMLRFVKEIPLSSTEESCSVLGCGVLHSERLHAGQAPHYPVTEKDLGDISTESKTLLHSIVESCRKMSSEGGPPLYPKAQHYAVKGEVADKFVPQSTFAHGSHDKSHTDHTFSTLRSSVPHKALTSPSQDLIMDTHDLRCNADHLKSIVQKSPISKGTPPGSICLVPYDSSDSDSFHSVSDDDSSFAAAVPATIHSEKNTKNSGENPCVLGHLISPTKRDWLQPSWKCPELRRSLPGCVNHSLFFCEDDEPNYNLELSKVARKGQLITNNEPDRICKAEDEDSEDDNDASFFLCQLPEEEENKESETCMKKRIHDKTTLWETESNERLRESGSGKKNMIEKNFEHCISRSSREKMIDKDIQNRIDLSETENITEKDSDYNTVCSDIEKIIVREVQDTLISDIEHVIENEIQYRIALSDIESVIEEEIQFSSCSDTENTVKRDVQFSGTCQGTASDVERDLQQSTAYSVSEFTAVQDVQGSAARSSMENMIVGGCDHKSMGLEMRDIMQKTDHRTISHSPPKDVKDCSDIPQTLSERDSDILYILTDACRGDKGRNCKSKFSNDDKGLDILDYNDGEKDDKTLTTTTNLDDQDDNRIFGTIFVAGGKKDNEAYETITNTQRVGDEKARGTIICAGSEKDVKACEIAFIGEAIEDDKVFRIKTCVDGEVDDEVYETIVSTEEDDEVYETIVNTEEDDKVYETIANAEGSEDDKALRSISSIGGDKDEKTSGYVTSNHEEKYDRVTETIGALKEERDAKAIETTTCTDGKEKDKVFRILDSPGEKQDDKACRIVTKPGREEDDEVTETKTVPHEEEYDDAFVVLTCVDREENAKAFDAAIGTDGEKDEEVFRTRINSNEKETDKASGMITIRNKEEEDRFFRRIIGPGKKENDKAFGSKASCDEEEVDKAIGTKTSLDEEKDNVYGTIMRPVQIHDERFGTIVSTCGDVFGTGLCTDFEGSGKILGTITSIYEEEKDEKAFITIPYCNEESVETFNTIAVSNVDNSDTTFESILSSVEEDHHTIFKSIINYDTENDSSMLETTVKEDVKNGDGYFEIISNSGEEEDGKVFETVNRSSEENDSQVLNLLTLSSEEKSNAALENGNKSKEVENISEALAGSDRESKNTLRIKTFLCLEDGDEVLKTVNTGGGGDKENIVEIKENILGNLNEYDGEVSGNVYETIISTVVEGYDKSFVAISDNDGENNCEAKYGSDDEKQSCLSFGTIMRTYKEAEEKDFEFMYNPNEDKVLESISTDDGKDVFMYEAMINKDSFADNTITSLDRDSYHTASETMVDPDRDIDDTAFSTICSDGGDEDTAFVTMSLSDGENFEGALQATSSIVTENGDEESGTINRIDRKDESAGFEILTNDDGRTSDTLLTMNSNGRENSQTDFGTIINRDGETGYKTFVSVCANRFHEDNVFVTIPDGNTDESLKTFVGNDMKEDVLDDEAELANIGVESTEDDKCKVDFHFNLEEEKESMDGGDKVTKNVLLFKIIDENEVLRECSYSTADGNNKAFSKAFNMSNSETTSCDEALMKLPDDEDDTEEVLKISEIEILHDNDTVKFFSSQLQVGHGDLKLSKSDPNNKSDVLKKLSHYEKKDSNEGPVKLFDEEEDFNEEDSDTIKSVSKLPDNKIDHDKEDLRKMYDIDRDDVNKTLKKKKDVPKELSQSKVDKDEQASKELWDRGKDDDKTPKVLSNSERDFDKALQGLPDCGHDQYDSSSHLPGCGRTYGDGKVPHEEPDNYGDDDKIPLESSNNKRDNGEVLQKLSDKEEDDNEATQYFSDNERDNKKAPLKLSDNEVSDDEVPQELYNSDVDDDKVQQELSHSEGDDENVQQKSDSEGSDDKGFAESSYSDGYNIPVAPQKFDSERKDEGSKGSSTSDGDDDNILQQLCYCEDGNVQQEMSSNKDVLLKLSDYEGPQLLSDIEIDDDKVSQKLFDSDQGNYKGQQELERIDDKVQPELSDKEGSDDKGPHDFGDKKENVKSRQELSGSDRYDNKPTQEFFDNEGDDKLFKKLDSEGDSDKHLQDLSDSDKEDYKITQTLFVNKRDKYKAPQVILDNENDTDSKRDIKFPQEFSFNEENDGKIPQKFSISEEGDDKALQTLSDSEEDDDKVLQKLSDSEEDDDKVLQKLTDSEEDADKVLQKLSDNEENDDKVLQKLTDSEEDADKVLQNLTDSEEVDNKLLQKLFDSEEDDDKVLQKLSDSEEDDDKVLQKLTDSEEDADKVLQKLSDNEENDDKVLQKLTDSEEDADKVLQNLTDSEEVDNKLLQKLFDSEENDDKVLQKLSDSDEDGDEFPQQLSASEKDNDKVPKQLSDSESDDDDLQQQLSDSERNDDEVLQELSDNESDDVQAPQELHDSEEDDEKVQQQLSNSENDNDELPIDLSDSEGNDVQVPQELQNSEGNDVQVSQELSDSENDDVQAPQELHDSEGDYDKVLQQLSDSESDDDKLPLDLSDRDGDYDKASLDLSDREADDDKVLQQLSDSESDDDKLPLDLSDREGGDVQAPQEFHDSEGDYDKVHQELSESESDDVQAPQEVHDSEEDDDKVLQQFSGSESDDDKASLDLSDRERNDSKASLDLSDREGDYDKAPLDLSDREGDYNKAPLDLSDREGNYDKASLDLSDREGDYEKAPLDLSDREGDYDKAPLDLFERQGDDGKAPQQLFDSERDHDEILQELLDTEGYYDKVLQELSDSESDDDKLPQELPDREEEDDDKVSIGLSFNEEGEDKVPLELSFSGEYVDKVYQQSSNSKKDDDNVPQKLSESERDDDEVTQKLSFSEEDDAKVPQELSDTERDYDKVTQELSDTERNDLRISQELSYRERGNDRVSQKLSDSESDDDKIPQQQSDIERVAIELFGSEGDNDDRKGNKDNISSLLPDRGDHCNGVSREYVKGEVNYDDGWNWFVGNEEDNGNVSLIDSSNCKNNDNTTEGSNDFQMEEKDHDIHIVLESSSSRAAVSDGNNGPLMTLPHSEIVDSDKEYSKNSSNNEDNDDNNEVLKGIDISEVDFNNECAIDFAIVDDDGNNKELVEDVHSREVGGDIDDSLKNSEQLPGIVKEFDIYKSRSLANSDADSDREPLVCLPQSNLDGEDEVQMKSPHCEVETDDKVSKEDGDEASYTAVDDEDYVENDGDEDDIIKGAFNTGSENSSGSPKQVFHNQGEDDCAEIKRPSFFDVKNKDTNVSGEEMDSMRDLSHVIEEIDPCPGDTNHDGALLNDAFCKYADENHEDSDDDRLREVCLACHEYRDCHGDKLLDHGALREDGFHGVVKYGYNSAANGIHESGKCVSQSDADKGNDSVISVLQNEAVKDNEPIKCASLSDADNSSVKSGADEDNDSQLFPVTKCQFEVLRNKLILRRSRARAKTHRRSTSCFELHVTKKHLLRRSSSHSECFSSPQLAPDRNIEVEGMGENIGDSINETTHGFDHPPAECRENDENTGDGMQAAVSTARSGFELTLSQYPSILRDKSPRIGHVFAFNKTADDSLDGSPNLGTLEKENLCEAKLNAGCDRSEDSVRFYEKPICSDKDILTELIEDGELIADTPKSGNYILKTDIKQSEPDIKQSSPESFTPKVLAEYANLDENFDTSCLEKSDLSTTTEQGENKSDVTFHEDVLQTGADNALNKLHESCRDSDVATTPTYQGKPEFNELLLDKGSVITHIDPIDQDNEVSRSSQESSQPDVTEFEESNLSSEDGAFEADISSFDSTLLAPSSEHCRVRARRCQTMKYCYMASARKSTGPSLGVPKFYSIYGSESGEDCTEIKDSRVLADQLDSLRDLERQSSPLSTEWENHIPVVSGNLQDNESISKEEKSSISPPKCFEPPDGNKSSSIRVRKDRYSSFFVCSSTVSGTPCKDPRDLDVEIESCILPTTAISDYSSVTGLPPKSQRKKPKGTQLRITCLEKSTPFSPKKFNCLSPQSSSKMLLGIDSKQYAECDVTVEGHDSTISGSGSIQLDSMYYTDSCGSPSYPDSQKSPWLNKESGCSESVTKPMQQKMFTFEKVYQVPQARKNLQYLFSTPKQAHTNTPDSNPDLYKVSPIDSDYLDTSAQDAENGTIKGKTVEVDLMGISGLEVFPDTKPFPKTNLTPLTETNRDGDTLISQPFAAGNLSLESAPGTITNRKKSPEKAVPFVMPHWKGDFFQESRDLYHATSTKINRIPNPLLEKSCRYTQIDCLGTLHETKEEADDCDDISILDPSDSKHATTDADQGRQSLEISYDPFMAGRTGSALSKPPRLSMIMEEEQDACPGEPGLELSVSLSASTPDDSVSTSQSPSTLDIVCITEASLDPSADDREFNVVGKGEHRNLEEGNCVQSPVGVLRCKLSASSDVAADLHEASLDEPKEILQEIVSKVAYNYIGTKNASLTPANDRESRLENVLKVCCISNDEVNSKSSHSGKVSDLSFKVQSGIGAANEETVAVDYHNASYLQNEHASDSTHCFSFRSEPDATPQDHIYLNVESSGVDSCNESTQAKKEEAEAVAANASCEDSIHLHLSVNVEGLEPCGCVCTCEEAHRLGAASSAPKYSRDDSPPTPVQISETVNCPQASQQQDDTILSPEQLFRKLQKDCQKFLRFDLDEFGQRKSVYAHSDSVGHSKDIQMLMNHRTESISNLLDEAETKAETCQAENKCWTFERACLEAAEAETVPDSVRAALVVCRALSDDDEETSTPVHNHNDSLTLEQQSHSSDTLPEEPITDADTWREEKISFKDEDVDKDTSCMDFTGSNKDMCDVSEPVINIQESIDKGADFDIDFDSQSFDNFPIENLYETSEASKADMSKSKLRASGHFPQTPSCVSVPEMSGEEDFTKESEHGNVSAFDLLNEGYYTLEVTLEGESTSQLEMTSVHWNSKLDNSNVFCNTNCRKWNSSSLDDTSIAELNNAFHTDQLDVLQTSSDFDGNGNCVRERSSNNDCNEVYSARGLNLDKCTQQRRHERSDIEARDGEGMAQLLNMPDTSFEEENVLIPSNNSRKNHGTKTLLPEAHSAGTVHNKRQWCSATILASVDVEDDENLTDYTEDMCDLDTDFSRELSFTHHSSDSSSSDPDILSHTSSTISEPAKLAELRANTRQGGHSTACGAGTWREGLMLGYHVMDPKWIGLSKEQNRPFDLDCYNSKVNHAEKDKASDSADERQIVQGFSNCTDVMGDCLMNSEYTGSLDGVEVNSSGLLGQSDLCDPDDLFAVSDTYLTEAESEEFALLEMSARLAESTVDRRTQRKRYHKFFIGNCEPDPSYGLNEECREWSWYIDRESEEEVGGSVSVEHREEDVRGDGSPCGLHKTRYSQVQCTDEHVDENFYGFSHAEFNASMLPPTPGCDPTTDYSGDRRFSNCERDIGHLPEASYEPPLAVLHHDSEYDHDVLGTDRLVFGDNVTRSQSRGQWIEECDRNLRERFNRVDEMGSLSLLQTSEDVNDLTTSSPRMSLSSVEEERGNFCPQCIQASSPHRNGCFCLSSVEDSPVQAKSPSKLDLSQPSPSRRGLDNSIESYTANHIDLASWSLGYWYDESDAKQFPHMRELKISADLNEGMRSIVSKRRRATIHVSFRDIMGLPESLKNYLMRPEDYDLTKLLREIMQEARNLTDAERCSVFLIDKDTDELVAMVFDGITADDKEVQGEIRLPKTQGIAGHVATTGTLLNIRDAYSHPLFYRGIDDSTGFRTRNILCFPIKDEEGVVLGVAQLCNKKTFQYFTTFDEDIASAFAVYCCISISHSLMYKKVIDIQYRNSLANELMMFHMKHSQGSPTGY
ncbi:hypothetical protein RRG08_005693 [Elysia crispata]|uniref:GAF domain-containing protein n=1 Tax=Elysia crispata TaxID=231223 RepID=A0AAE1CX05_9GAST|nr:hypothetical protein RRG08_005693 [Elysia crispata]